MHTDLTSVRPALRALGLRKSLMVSKAKLYSRLDSLEAELEEGFVPHLRNAANGENDLVFCVSAFNPFRELKNHTDKKTEEFIEIGSQILSLRNKLGESYAGTKLIFTAFFRTCKQRAPVLWLLTV